MQILTMSFLKSFNFQVKKVSTSILSPNISKFIQICNQHTDTKRVSPTFSELISQRRLESKRSIIVQVHSAQSYGDLYKYCSQFGTINNIHHYSLGSEPLHFIIVEFNLPSDVLKVFSRSCHVYDNEVVSLPVISPFLWFRANQKHGIKKKTIDIPDVTLNSENGTKMIPQDELVQLLRQSENISDQMSTLLNYSSLSETGTRLRFLTCRQIELALSGMFPNVTALPFGSSVNSFGKEGCDLDIVMHFDPLLSQNETKNRLAFHSKTVLLNGRTQTLRHMECTADIIQLFLPGCVNVRRILQARVPIIKFNNEYTGLECDLSMTNMSGVYMSDLLYTLNTIDERICPLVFTVKYWAKSNYLTSTSPGRWITNFSLTLLVLNFLQNLKVLPSVKLLMQLAEPKDKTIIEDGINCTFLHDVSKLPKIQKPNNDSLESLLFQFFEYYSSFDFSTRAISLNEGKDISKPDQSALYIVNPLEQHLNVSKNVSQEELERFRIQLRNAAWILESNEMNKRNSQTNWGLLAFCNMKSGSVLAKNFEQSRLIQIETIFNESDDTKKDSKSLNINPNFIKNKSLKNEIKIIKLETAKNIKNIEKGNKRNKTFERRR